MRSLILSVLLCLAVSVAGPACGGGGTVETNVRLPAAERPDISPASAKSAIRVPAEVAFNYPRFSSGQEGGKARGSAVADGGDGASCFAEVTGEGKAWGSFQLGYAFDHQSASASRCVVRVKLMAEESAQGAAAKTAGGQKPAEGAVNLVFFMKDSMGVTVKEESLVSSTLNRGPRGATTQHNFVFDADLQPERGYYFVVSGRVDASASDGQEARVELNVSDVALEIRWEDGSRSVRAAQGP